jgi:hypothetical protein
LSFCSDSQLVNRNRNSQSQHSRRKCVPLDTGPPTVNVNALHDVVCHGTPPSLRLDMGPAREHAQSAIRVSLSQHHCLSARLCALACNKASFSNGAFYHVKLPVRARIRKLDTALAHLVCLHLCIPMTKSCTSKFIQLQTIISDGLKFHQELALRAKNHWRRKQLREKQLLHMDMF